MHEEINKIQSSILLFMKENNKFTENLKEDKIPAFKIKEHMMCITKMCTLS